MRGLIVVRFLMSSFSALAELLVFIFNRLYKIINMH